MRLYELNSEAMSYSYCFGTVSRTARQRLQCTILQKFLSSFLIVLKVSHILGRLVLSFLQSGSCVGQKMTTSIVCVFRSF